MRLANDCSFCGAPASDKVRIPQRGVFFRVCTDDACAAKVDALVDAADDDADWQRVYADTLLKEERP
jgi:hypothetical protein